MITLVPLLSGSIFLAFGTNMIVSDLRFRRKGTPISGCVKAIEKYKSTSTRTNSNSATSTYFRPIVEYTYKDETKTLSGLGSNEIHHKLSQNVTIYIHETEGGKIQARLEGGGYCVMGAIFTIIGLIAIGVYIFALQGSIPLALIITSGFIGVGHLISSLIWNFRIHMCTENAGTPKEGSVMIETKADYLEEVSAHSFWGSLLAFSLMIGGLFVAYSGASMISSPPLPQDQLALLYSNFGEFMNQLTNSKLSSQWEKPLIITGVGIFFFLASIRSIYYIRKKYGRLLKL